MSAETASSPRSHLSSRGRRIVTIAGVVVVLVAMALGTKVVDSGSAAGAQAGKFAAAAYGKTTFPKIQKAIDSRAVEAATFAQAVATDQTAAAKRYGVDAGTGPEISIKFTGVVGAGESGVYQVQVDGVPSNVLIRVQTGPAINGTDLRDATGTVKFGQFTNQIDFQNAASAINNEMKKSVLSKIDTASLTGKTISVFGAFQLINPSGWLVTPSRLTVQ